MTPFAKCEAEFKRRYPNANFWLEMLFYINTGGVVHSTPDYFVMGRKVQHTATQDEMRHTIFPIGQRDTWFFAWFAGDMEKVWQAETPLEYVAFEREHGGELELIIAKTSVMRRLTVTEHGLPSATAGTTDRVSADSHAGPTGNKYLARGDAG